MMTFAFFGGLDILGMISVEYLSEIAYMSCKYLSVTKFMVDHLFLFMMKSPIKWNLADCWNQQFEVAS